MMTAARMRGILLFCFWITIVGGIIARYGAAKFFGTTVLIPVGGVDPRSLFRGEYATLTYPINTIWIDHSGADFSRRQKVWIIPIMSGDRFQGIRSLSTTKPQVFSLPARITNAGNARGSRVSMDVSRETNTGLIITGNISADVLSQGEREEKKDDHLYTLGQEIPLTVSQYGIIVGGEKSFSDAAGESTNTAVTGTIIALYQRVLHTIERTDMSGHIYTRQLETNEVFPFSFRATLEIAACPTGWGDGWTIDAKKNNSLGFEAACVEAQASVITSNTGEYLISREYPADRYFVQQGNGRGIENDLQGGSVFAVRKVRGSTIVLDDLRIQKKSSIGMP